jgi:glycosyltransferase involved in cell wall biosynthesis
VSGWAQLNGKRRCISCIVPARNELAALRTLLPALSDRLTECGYPWEIIVVDRASADATESVLRAWCDLPGFRLIALDDPFDRASALVLGLEAARGDAVILLDANTDDRLSALNEVILRWESGRQVIYATADPHTGDTVVRSPRALPGADRTSELGMNGDTAELVLLDREVVRGLMR